MRCNFRLLVNYSLHAIHERKGIFNKQQLPKFVHMPKLHFESVLHQAYATSHHVVIIVLIGIS